MINKYDRLNNYFDLLLTERSPRAGGDKLPAGEPGLHGELKARLMAAHLKSLGVRSGVLDPTFLAGLRNHMLATAERNEPFEENQFD